MSNIAREREILHKMANSITIAQNFILIANKKNTNASDEVKSYLDRSSVKLDELTRSLNELSLLIKKKAGEG